MLWVYLLEYLKVQYIIQFRWNTCTYKSFRSKAGSSIYSRILIPDPTTVGDSNKFPGEAVAMGGNILPLEEQFDSRKSLRFHKGNKKLLLFHYTC